MRQCKRSIKHWTLRQRCPTGGLARQVVLRPVAISVNYIQYIYIYIYIIPKRAQFTQLGIRLTAICMCAYWRNVDLGWWWGTGQFVREGLELKTPPRPPTGIPFCILTSLIHRRRLNAPGVQKFKNNKTPSLPPTLNCVFISVINELDAQNFCFTISLFLVSTCFEHMCSSSWGQNCITQPLVSSHL